MKNKNLFKTVAIAYLLLLFTTMNARVWRVNNNATYNQWTGEQVFSNLQTAISSNLVLNGDILYLEASGISYGTATITNKALTIIGTGYFLDDNPQLQNNHTTAKINQLTFGAGSSGSSIYGIEFVNADRDIFFSVNTLSNITISRCKFHNGIDIDGGSNYSNILISKNYFDANFTVDVTSGGTISNMTITNNYFGGNITLRSTTVATISHNVIRGVVSIYGNPFYNNILLTTSASVTQNNNSSDNVYNNIFRITQPAWLNNAGNNTFGVTEAYLFNNINDTEEKKYILKAQGLCPECYQGYPSNVQIGMYGGNDTYILSGIPAIPAIYTLNASANAPQNGTLNVIISTRSNN